jgi:hypothetical protein
LPYGRPLCYFAVIFLTLEEAGVADQQNDYPEMDYAAHNATYDAFITITKYTVFGLVVLLALMAVFL